MPRPVGASISGCELTISGLSGVWKSTGRWADRGMWHSSRRTGRTHSAHNHVPHTGMPGVSLTCLERHGLGSWHGPSHRRMNSSGAKVLSHCSWLRSHGFLNQNLTTQPPAHRESLCTGDSVHRVPASSLTRIADTPAQYSGKLRLPLNNGT